MAHTPGPWLAAARPSSVVGLPIVATPSGRSIASVTFFSLGEEFASHDRESQANARLIALAPEMRDLIADIEQSLTADGTHRMLREACQALLAKAERV